MSQLAYCSEGCNNRFYVTEFKVDQLPGAIEKIYFNCIHCDHEYLVFYTDIETRKLQERMRKLHMKFGNPNEDQAKLYKQEKRLKNQIERSMTIVKTKALR